MLENRRSWKEEASFEARQRRTVKPNKRTEKARVLVGWHEPCMYEVRTTERTKVFYETARKLERHGLSPIVAAPTLTIEGYNTGYMKRVTA